METLSYFSTKSLEKGTIVYVPLRKKEIPAIVLSSEDISDSKVKIKNANFALKKIENKKTFVLLLPEFIEAAASAAEYFATTTGAILYKIIPKIILDNIKETKRQKIRENKNILSRKLILQSEINDRFVNYKSLVREEFARNSSVFLLAPTIQDAEKAGAFLKKGIERYTFVLHSSLTKKEILTRWKNALQSGHPVLIIATSSFLSLPRNDIETIIVERENSRAYKQFARPFIDMKIFAEFYVKHKKMRLILGDFPLSVETMWRYYNNEFDELSPPKLRVIKTAEQTLIDMKNKKYQKAGQFEIISDELKNLISKTIKEDKNIFIFAARRGLSPTTICRDCGSPVLCLRCEAPAILYTTMKGNCFICRACGSSRSANERCKNCASWRLETLGIGIQLVEKKLKEFFPDQQIFVIDKDDTETHKKVLMVIEKFYATRGGILIGTEMALPYFNKMISYSAVASIDSLFSLPEWRMPEKILSLLLKIKEITKKEILIQTRKPEQKIFDFVIKGNLADFYKDEIKKRKQFNYPPFCVFVKITVIGIADKVAKETEYMKKLLKDYGILTYPPSIKADKGKYIMRGLLRIERNKWPHKEIVEILRSLPPHFSVDVDTESLL